MPRRSRVSSTIDMGRLSAAVSRPGIDPRVWCSYAYAMSDSVIDADHGHFVDVKLLPTKLQVTVRVPQQYAGGGFGNHYGVIHKDDELVVLFPDGDPASGGFAVMRAWNAADKPPELWNANPSDVGCVIEQDLNYRVLLTGTGEFLVESAQKAELRAPTVVAHADHVFLGAETATDALILGTTYRAQEFAMNTAVLAGLGTIAAAGAQISAAAALHIIPIVGPMIASPLLAAAGASLTAGAGAMTTAISTFDTGPTAYLSGVSKTA